MREVWLPYQLPDAGQITGDLEAGICALSDLRTALAKWAKTYGAIRRQTIANGKEPIPAERPDRRELDQVTANVYRQVECIRNQCGRSTSDTLAELKKPERKDIRDSIEGLRRKLDADLIEAARKWCKSHPPRT
jgi:hypothetical protein